MDPLGQGIEIETGRSGDHDLAIEDAAIRHIGQQGVDQLGEVPGERLLVAAARARRRRRRGTRCNGSRPTSARRRGRHASGSSRVSLASMGGHGRYHGERHRPMRTRAHQQDGDWPTPRGRPSRPGTSSSGRVFMTRSTGTPDRRRLLAAVALPLELARRVGVGVHHHHTVERERESEQRSRVGRGARAWS